MAGEQPVVRPHSKHTQMSPHVPPFREEDESVSLKRQTSAYEKGEGRERQVGNRGVLAEVTACRLAGATYRAPKEQQM